LPARTAPEDDRPVRPRAFESAGYFTRRRGFAWAIDVGLVIGAAAGGASVFGVEDVWDWLVTTPGFELLVALGFVYLAFLTPRYGQSLGKLAVGLCVTRTDGRPPGRLRLLGRAVFDMATVAAFLYVVSNFVPEREPGHTPELVDLLITPCLLLAWFVRDRVLDLQLSQRR
jgi:uncharacterized RDD family membrane protein YckC